MNFTWLAWLNIGRNRRRTILLLLITSGGTAGLIINGGLIAYIFNGLRDDAIYGRYGHIQIYKRGYALNHRQAPFDYWIPDAECSRAEAALRNTKEVQSVTAEASLPVFLTSGERSAAGVAAGVVPADLHLLEGAMPIAGDYAIRDAGSYADAVMGAGLAQKLQLRVGDFFTISAAGRSGTYNALDVRVNGIFEEGFRDYDDWTLKLPLSVVQKLSDQSGAEKIVVILRNTSATDNARAAISLMLQKQGLSVETASWHELADFYRQVLAMFGKELQVIQWIIECLVFLAVVSALAMMFTERQHEMATLIAMGMTRFKLALLIGQESLCLGVLSAGCGAVIGTTVGYVVSRIGIHMPPPPGSTRSFIARVYLSPGAISHFCLLTCAVACLAALVPAIWIWRLDVASSLRQERA
jgi:putative ABC transport system permease protein